MKDSVIIEFNKLSISSLENKVDSLQKIVERTEIGENYFIELLGLQRDTFGFLLAAFALLSWGSIMLYINYKINMKTKNVVESLKRIEEIEFQTYKSMFFSCKQSEYYLSAFLWAIRVLNFYAVHYPNVPRSEVREWLTLSKHQLRRVQAGDIQKKDKEEFLLLMGSLMSENDSKTLKDLRYIEDQFLKKYYHK